MPVLRPSGSDFTSFVKAAAQYVPAGGGGKASKSGGVPVSLPGLGSLVRTSQVGALASPTTSSVIINGVTPPPPSGPPPPPPVGTITTLLSSGLLFPSGVAVISSSSTIVIADTNNSVIKLLTYPGLSVSTLAGTAGSNSFADGTGSAARFQYPEAVSVLQDGNIVVADTSNHRIRIVTQAGVVTTLAGDGTPGQVNGTGTGATFSSPRAIAVLQDGNIIVGASGSIRLVTYPGGVVTTFATGFNSPYGIAVLPNGNIAVADSSNHVIKLVTYPGAVVTTLAGSSGTSGSSDGTGSAAKFYLPTGITGTLDGNIVVSDFFNYTMRLVTPLGVVTTIAGLVGTSGNTDGTGTVARVNRVKQIATLPSGQIVLAAEVNYSIRMLTYPA